MDKDLIVTCPYNSSHRIRRFKLIHHMIKCKKYYDTGDIITCPLNNSHVINRNEIADHIASCSSLATLVQDDNEEEINPEPAINVDAHKLFEDWDKLPEAPSYNAMEHSAKKKVIRCVSGFSKSEKKKFRENERIRLADLNGVNITRPTLSLPKDTEHEIQLRPPRGEVEVLRSIRAMQDNFHRIEQTSDSNADISVKSTACNELLDTFHKALYDELLSDYESDANKEEDTSIFNHNPFVESEDSKKIKNVLLNKPISSDTIYMAPNKSLNSPSESPELYSQDVDEGKYVPIFNQDHKNEANEVQKDTDGVPHKELDRLEEKFDCIERPFNTSTLHTSRKQITDRLLALLRGDANTNVVMVKPAAEMEKGIQNAVYERSPLLIKKLNDLKLSKEGSCMENLKHKNIPNDNNILNNPRCAATFANNISPVYKEQLETTDSESKQTFAQNKQGISEYSLNMDTDTSNLKDNKYDKVYKLKTPQDFC